MHNKDNKKGLLFALTTSVLWGFLAVALKITLNYFDALTIVWSRFVIAFLIMVIYYAIRAPKRLSILWNPPWLLVLGSVFLGINYLGFMQGINHAGPGITQVFIQTGPITLGFIGFLFFKERLTVLRAMGFFFAAIGFFFFYYQQLNSILGNVTEVNQGILWVILGATAWVGYAICNKILVRTHHPLELNLLLYGIPAVAYAFTADYSLLTSPHEWWVWLLLIFLGINTAVAYGALSAALKYTESNKISIVITVNPIITFLLLELMLHFNIGWIQIDAFSSMAYIGALFVLIGAILAIGVFNKKKP